LETEVAKHLSDDYGDRAWTVCSLAEPTGKGWPLHGIRLDDQYPYIEAEVRYAVRHEYAQRAVDVLARRTRLSFLNVQAALRALPRVVDIMGDELNWSRSRKWAEIERAAQFFESMGLAPGSLTVLPEPMPRGIVEKIQSTLWRTISGGIYGGTSSIQKQAPHIYSRAKFEPGEVAILKVLFEKHASGVSGEEKVYTKDILELLKELPAYEEIKPKTYEYVLVEAGFKGKVDVDFHEFLEICGNLKEVAFAPSLPALKRRRLGIPVEKSGGGV